MKFQSPLSPHPPLHLAPAPDEAEIRARIKSIQDSQQQEVITTIFQQARSNISYCPLNEPIRNASATIERNLHSKYPNHNKNPNNKDGGGPSVVDHTKPPPEPAPIYIPKDLSEMIANGTKQDAAYYVYEAVVGCQTKVKDFSAREKEFAVVGSGVGIKVDEGDGRMPASAVGFKREVEGVKVKEEQTRVQRNTLDVARDPRLQRR